MSVRILLSLPGLRSSFLSWDFRSGPVTVGEIRVCGIPEVMGMPLPESTSQRHTVSELNLGTSLSV